MAEDLRFDDGVMWPDDVTLREGTMSGIGPTIAVIFTIAGEDLVRVALTPKRAGLLGHALVKYAHGEAAKQEADEHAPPEQGARIH